MRFSVSRSPSPVQRTLRRPTNAYSIHNITDDEDDSSSSSSEPEEAQALTFSHAGTRRDTSLALVKSNPNPEHTIDAFLNAVKLRSKIDPIEEYQNAERAAIKNAHPPVPSLPHISQAITQSYAALQAKRNAEEMAAVLGMVERLDIQCKGLEEESMRVVKEENKGIWEGIEGAIRRDEEKKRLEQERVRLEEEKKRLEEERKRAELKVAEGKKKAEEQKKKQEREEEERRQKEKEDKEKAEEQARKASQEKEAQVQAAKEAQLQVQASQPSAQSLPAIQEWENAWAERAALKKLTKSVEENPDLRSTAGKPRRKLRTRVGQVTNSLSELEKLADAIHEIISPSPPHPDPVYTALLSAFSKYLLLQAETEVTAKLPTAYPLARLVWLVVARGHPKLWDVFWARFVGRTGGWGVGVHLTRKAGTSDTEWRKLTGRELEGKNDPDDKPPTLETTTQYTDRIVGQLALYAAILQTSIPSQLEPQLESVPAQFRLTRLWTWLARVLNSREMLGSSSAPQCLSVVLEVGGDRMAETFGGQFKKLLGAVNEVVGRGVGGEGETGARVRLGLLLERWEKEGKFGLDGRVAER
ncbi:Nucleoporin gle1 [Rhizoctonia solani]|uniref:mRNA export factor GLE1 n=1 Tax=Rhizoctonia solani TaxID=456999 RepID=A0A0K6GIN6_9AGAM|nr:Nucleoporin gle1 [Rhizoctonia solani]